MNHFFQCKVYLEFLSKLYWLIVYIFYYTVILVILFKITKENK